MRGLPFTTLALAVLICGCATKGAGPVEDSLSIRLLTMGQATNKFYAEGAPNPFTSGLIRITTQPKNFLTADLHVPKTVKSVNIAYMVVLAKDGSQIAEAASKKEMVDYWESMAGETSDRRKQLDAIERYYLPSVDLSGSSLGRDYAIVFLSQRPFEPTDRVLVSLTIDGESKDMEIGADTVIQAKKK